MKDLGITFSKASKEETIMINKLCDKLEKDRLSKWNKSENKKGIKLTSDNEECHRYMEIPHMNIGVQEIPVPSYIDKSKKLKVEIIASCEKHNCCIIICKMNNETYQDFYYNGSQKVFKILTEFGETFCDWWYEEYFAYLEKEPIFKDFKDKNASWDYKKYIDEHGVKVH